MSECIFHLIHSQTGVERWKKAKHAGRACRPACRPCMQAVMQAVMGYRQMLLHAGFSCPGIP